MIKKVKILVGVLLSIGLLFGVFALIAIIILADGCYDYSTLDMLLTLICTEGISVACKASAMTLLLGYFYTID